MPESARLYCRYGLINHGAAVVRVDEVDHLAVVLKRRSCEIGACRGVAEIAAACYGDRVLRVDSP